VVLQELGEARDTPNDIIFDELWEAAVRRISALGPLVLGDEAEHRADPIDEPPPLAPERYRAGSLPSARPGKVDHDAWSALAQARSPGFGRHARRSRAGELNRRHTHRPGARPSRPHLALSSRVAAQLDEDYSPTASFR
jgi:hypothetical protein